MNEVVNNVIEEFFQFLKSEDFIVSSSSLFLLILIVIVGFVFFKYTKLLVRNLLGMSKIK